IVIPPDEGLERFRASARSTYDHAGHGGADIPVCQGRQECLPPQSTSFPNSRLGTRREFRISAVALATAADSTSFPNSRLGTRREFRISAAALATAADWDSCTPRRPCRFDPVP